MKLLLTSQHKKHFILKRAFFNENQSLFDLSHYDRYRVINTRRIGAKSSYDCDNSIDEDGCNNAKRAIRI